MSMHKSDRTGEGLSRRAALTRMVALAGATVIRLPVRAAAGAPVVRFGVISDVHQDVMPDGVERIRAFVAAMTEAQAAFVLQLGDFCQPKPANQDFLAAWNTFAGPRYHVLGNHDMDGGFSREQAVAFYGMPARHYTFAGGGFLGIVLDGNDPGGRQKGYKRYVAADQRAWLERMLAEAKEPAVVFIHQPLDDAQGVENAAEVRAVLRAAEQRRAGSVLAVFSGHLHQDYLREVDGLSCTQINSASYYWVDSAGKSTAYFPAAVHQRHPSLQYVAAYRDPLWALVEVDRAAGEIRVQGRNTEWVGPSAPDRARMAESLPQRAFIRPSVSDRRIKVAPGAS